MAGQTQLEQVKEDNGRTIAGNLRDELGELAHDVLTLVELQVELLVADLRDTTRRASRWAIVLGGACLLTLGCIPVAVLGIAYVVAWAGMPLELSMLLVALTLMTASGVIAVAGWRRLKTAAGPLQRSRRELQKNLDWFKRTLANDRGSETKRLDRAAPNLINSAPHP